MIKMKKNNGRKYFVCLVLGLFISIVAPGCSYGQSFEGTLVYSAEIEPSASLIKMGMDESALKGKMQEEGVWADTMRVVYKVGNYRSEMESRIKSWSVYRSDSNKIYSFQENSELCTITDASVDTEGRMLKKNPSVEILDTTATVFNKRCKIVRVQWQSGHYDYYFKEGFLSINPELYKGHKYDGWYEFLKLSKSLPIKVTKVTNGVMSVSFTLEKVVKHKVKDSVFILPELIPPKEKLAVTPPNKVIMKIKEE